jgi:peptide/nickel transport system permease protein
MVRLGIFVVLLTALGAVVGPSVLPFDPAAQDLPARLSGPTLTHPFGLDELGRDILVRVLVGARISLIVGLSVVLISATVGTILGSAAGYFGGVFDEVVSRIADILLAFPGLLLAIALVAVLGPSLVNVLLALTFIGWVGYARVARGQALRARELEYVQAAVALGAGPARVIARHIIPASLPLVLVQATLGMAGAILAEAALSFLGLGVQPPTPSWGTMLDGGRAHMLDAPHLTLFPGLAIAVLVLGLNMLGEGLRARINPQGGIQQ